MCSVADLINVGYTSSDISDETYCPPVGTFISSFSKKNYTSTVTGRSDDQLFPLSDISESRIVLEPTLVFTYTKLGLSSSDESKYNGFSYSNLEGPWTVAVSNQSVNGHFSARVDSVNNRVIVTSNATNTDFEYTGTVTLTGTRTDGLGTYSASFDVIQYARVTEYYLRIWYSMTTYPNARFQINNSAEQNNTVISMGEDTEITIDAGETITIVNIDQDVPGSDNVNFKLTSAYNGVAKDLGSGHCLNEASIGYAEIANNYPGKEGSIIDIYIEPV